MCTTENNLSHLRNAEGCVPYNSKTTPSAKQFTACNTNKTAVYSKRLRLRQVVNAVPLRSVPRQIHSFINRFIVCKKINVFVPYNSKTAPSAKQFTACNTNKTAASSHMVDTAVILLFFFIQGLCPFRFYL